MLTDPEPLSVSFANTLSSSLRDRIGTLEEFRGWTKNWPTLQPLADRLTAAGSGSLLERRDATQSVLHAVADGRKPSAAAFALATDAGLEAAPFRLRPAARPWAGCRPSKRSLICSHDRRSTSSSAPRRPDCDGARARTAARCSPAHVPTVAGATHAYAATVPEWRHTHAVTRDGGRTGPPQLSRLPDRRRRPAAGGTVARRRDGQRVRAPRNRRGRLRRPGRSDEVSARVARPGARRTGCGTHALRTVPTLRRTRELTWLFGWWTAARRLT
ncbi:hypothetical protein QFZ63_002386 [Streptomyces sp. B3I7]|nr:hypothetical protein [Streptomyces sp. B3I7]